MNNATEETPTKLTLSAKRPGTAQLTIPAEKVMDVIAAIRGNARRFLLEIETDQKRKYRRRKSNNAATKETKKK